MRVTSPITTRRTGHTARSRLAIGVAAVAIVVAGSRTAGAQCDGDCNADVRVTIDELISGVRIALGSQSLEACSAVDMNVDGVASINELIAAVNNALLGCPPPPVRVERFDVAADETRDVTAGVEIIARAGAAIHGTVRIAAAAPGARTADFLLTVADGDLLVDGTIGFAADGSEPATAEVTATVAGLACVSPAPGELSAPDGGGIRLRVRRGSVILSPRSKLRTADGKCAQTPPPLDTLGSGEDFIAYDGGNGGSITLNVSRTVTIEERTANDGPLFDLGSGGDGASVFVARGFATAGEAARFVGGNGGNGGRLTITTPELTVVEDEVTPAELVSGGSGGRGGEVLWDNTERGLDDSDPPLSSVFDNLRRIGLLGGAGGMGARLGGPGGAALYASGRAIYPVGSQLGGTVFVGGGAGGGVHPSPVTIRGARGGDGGGFAVIGNWGWDAGTNGDGALERNGGAASAVSARGGDGGDVPLDRLTFPDGHGGDGGNTAADVADFPLGGGPAYVTGGAGGDGWSACEEKASGGDGGPVYRVVVHAGKGGDGPRCGGNGGNIGPVFKGQSGFGGDGKPPGSCGSILDNNGEERDVLEPGTGGESVEPFNLAEDGEIRGEVTEAECTNGECCPVERGAALGNGETMCEESGGCNFQIGDTFTAFDFTRSDCDFGDGHTELTESSLMQEGRLVEFDSGSRFGRWVIEQQNTYFRQVDGRVLDDVSFTDTAEFSGLSPSLGIPNCVGAAGCLESQYRLYVPGTPAPFEFSYDANCACRVTVKRLWGGCSPEVCARCGGCNLCYADEFPCAP